jgi:hypothetical protein
MSNQYKHGEDVPTDVLTKRLDELSDACTKRGEDFEREFTIRIPAELDRDADLVMHEASRRLVQLERERDALAAHVARLCRSWWEVYGADDDNAGAIQAMHDVVISAPTTFLALRDAGQRAGAVMSFAHEVWDEMLKRQKVIRVMPLTMAKDWISRQAEGGA